MTEAMPLNRYPRGNARNGHMTSVPRISRESRSDHGIIALGKSERSEVKTMGLSTEVIVAIVTSGCAAVSSIFVAIIGCVGGSRMKRRDQQDSEYKAQLERIDAKREQQHKERQDVYDALLRGIDASLSANEISLIALQHGKLNGNVEAARRKVQKAEADLDAATSKAVTHLTDAD